MKPIVVLTLFTYLWTPLPLDVDVESYDLRLAILDSRGQLLSEVALDREFKHYLSSYSAGRGAPEELLPAMEPAERDVAPVIVCRGPHAHLAAQTVLLRLKPAELPGLALLACCGVVGVVLLAPLAAAELLFLGGEIRFTPASVAAVVYVGIFPSFVGYVFWNRAVAEVGSNVAGIFIHLMPAFGSLLAWMFLGEHIRAFHLAGIALILAGVWLTARGRRELPLPETE